MAPKHWTILIVPPGTGEARTIHIGPRARQAILGGAITAGLLVMAAITVLFTPYGTPSARLLAAQNVQLRNQSSIRSVSASPR